MKGRFVHKSLNQAIDKHGWVVIGVPGKALYTVGLISKVQHPEVMIHGLTPDQCYGVLSTVAKHVLNDGVRYEPGVLYDQVLVGYQVKFIEVARSNFDDWLGQASDYVGDDLRVLQVLWPDKQGKFPGDEGYDVLRFGCQWRFDARRPEYEDSTGPHEPCSECGGVN